MPATLNGTYQMHHYSALSSNSLILNRNFPLVPGVYDKLVDFVITWTTYRHNRATNEPHDNLNPVRLVPY